MSTRSSSVRCRSHRPGQSQYGMELGLVAEAVGARQAVITIGDNARVLRVPGDVGTWKREGPPI